MSHIADIVDAIYDSHAPLESNNDGARPTKGFLQGIIEGAVELADLDSPIIGPSALPAIFDALKNSRTGEGLDDRKLLLEKMLVLMSCLPKNMNSLSQKLQDAAIELFYKDLPHPPSYIVPPKRSLYNPELDDYKPYPYRAADGSNNNPLQPILGMAGQPYARTVPSKNLSPGFSLPDPGLVFDTLLRKPKDAEFKPHPAGISALFFAFADLVIHSIFNTDHRDYTINKTSSYLDLSPLYGNNEAEVNKVRRFPRDGTGRLWDDVFSDARLLHMPPAVCALLVLLSRNHNYIATKLLTINERGLYRDPSKLNGEEKEAQDDRLFHQTRLINTGYFMQIILGDYVGAILGLARDRRTWRLDPLIHMRSSKDHAVSPLRGEGSLVSVEFNLMYRWHSTISQEDTKWTETLFNKLFDNKAVDEVTFQDFVRVIAQLKPKGGPREWVFDGAKRDSSGRFNDADLAKILQDSTGSIAGAFQARGTPDCMRIIEVLGIEESRAWGTCSMNEFRKFMGLKPYKSFEEWNSNEDVHKAAAALYKDIDNLELYVGLHAEQAKEPGPGAGLCPGYTISRAILSDAVCLTRGDRFLTTEFTPYNLTTWGYQDCILSDAEKEDGSYGGVLTKLLFRTLPDYYPAGSAYAHFPFYVPKTFKQEWLKNGHIDLVSKYSWDRPQAPLFPVISVNEVKPEWQSAFETRINRITEGVDLDINLAKKALEAKERKWDQKFADHAKGLIASKSFVRAGKTGKFVDIVRDVINLLPVHWIAESVAGLSLKSKEHPDGRWEEQEVYDDLAAVAEYLLLNFEPTNDWILRERSAAFYREKFLKSVSDSLKGSISGWVVSLFVQTQDADSKEFLAEVRQGKQEDSIASLSASIFAQVASSAAQYSHVLSLVVDHYAEDEDKKKEFIRLAGLDTKEGSEAFIKLVREALAANPPVSSIMRTCMADSIVGNDKVQAGQRVFINLPTSAQAATNDSVFPGLSTYGLLSPSLFAQTAPKVLAVIFGLKGLKKVSKLQSFTEAWRDGKDVRYTCARGKTSPFPPSLVVQYGA